MRDQATTFTTFDSPVGTIVINSRGGKIRGIRIMTVDGQFAPHESWHRDDEALASAQSQFERYFAGELREFSLRLAIEGTQFQLRAWEALCRVPFGQTTTYGAIARSIGCPNGSRAVGLAMNRNPFTIAVPCHRVVGSNGRLTGFLNGLDTKRWLLAFEAGDRVASGTLQGVLGSRQ